MDSAVESESDYEEFIGSFRASVGNGLLIVRASESVSTHEGWQDEDIHVEPDSIYLCVQHPVDGPVTVEIYEGRPGGVRPDLVIALDETIQSLSGTYIVQDPAQDIRLVVRTDRSGPSRLRIAVDELSRPAAVQLHFW